MWVDFFIVRSVVVFHTISVSARKDGIMNRSSTYFISGRDDGFMDGVLCFYVESAHAPNGKVRGGCQRVMLLQVLDRFRTVILRDDSQMPMLDNVSITSW